MKNNQTVNISKYSRLKKYLLIAPFLLISMGYAQGAFAAQWVATGRALYIESEDIQPYLVSYSNICQGGVQGPSGAYTYQDQGDYGSCSTDASTGFGSNFNAVRGGQCLPQPGSVGGGYSCEDHYHVISGQKSNGVISITCSNLGSYAIDYSRRVDLVDFGLGDLPNDFYEKVSERASEYKCQ